MALHGGLARISVSMVIRFILKYRNTLVYAIKASELFLCKWLIIQRDHPCLPAAMAPTVGSRHLAGCGALGATAAHVPAAAAAAPAVARTRQCGDRPTGTPVALMLTCTLSRAS